MRPTLQSCDCTHLVILSSRIRASTTITNATDNAPELNAMALQSIDISLDRSSLINPVNHASNHNIVMGVVKLLPLAVTPNKLMGCG